MVEMNRNPIEFQAWLSQAPAGTLVPAELLVQVLSATVSDTGLRGLIRQPMSWRERLWIVPADTRLGVAELLEALGRTRSWLYRHTGPKCRGARIPHRKLEGELVFLAGEVRQWLLENEVIIVPGRTQSLVVTRKQSSASAGRPTG